MLEENGADGGALKRRFARQGVEQHDASRVEVRGCRNVMIDRSSLFGRRVKGDVERLAIQRGVGLNRSGGAKVDERRPSERTARAEDQVGWANAAVKDLSSVEIAQCREERTGDDDGFVE